MTRMRRPARPLIVLLAGLAGAAAGVSAAGAQAGGSAGSGTAGPATTVTAAPGSTEPSGPPAGSPQQQTHPATQPRRPTRRSHITVRFTLSDAPGHQGVVESNYRIEVDQPAGSRAACAAAAPADVASGKQGDRVTVPLPPPRYGWCRGTYSATVVLQRGPYCPAPQDGQPPQPCPEFASRDVQVGRSTFLVHAPRR
jgi:hypothetical protein